MTTSEVALKLVAMCREGKVEEAKQELFHKNITSTEPAEGILPKETKGMEAIKRKAELFISMVEEFCGNTISEPVVAGNYFSVSWHTDIKLKGAERATNSEICLYKVQDGKIISEQFFY